MFAVDKNPTFTHVVKVKVPVNGGYEDQTIKTTFNVIPVEEAVKFDLTEGQDTTAFLKRAVAHMDDLVDVEKNPLPYNDDLRDQLIALPYVRSALARSYFASVSGAFAGN
ncbi:hypothetical protein CG471_21765 [Sphingobium sp. IP1]|uniref:hypothetical protein n=1 Tax=Sphingobium sp. IP1 TaxID=2021637 RepID=UPI000C08D98B|nr:hypothetical protein [Sphingobium sp. IP1]PHP17652.1 hypothetical protein CG471_21765 [Sphingobium sp. IP1]